MKATTYQKYGSPDVLKLADVAKPTPGDDQVLVKVKATAVNFVDHAFVHGSPFIIRFMQGLFKPKNPILGADIAGVVEAVGRDVSQFEPGDEVYGDMGDFGLGGFAQYIVVPPHAIAGKPINLSFEEAAAVPQAAVVALQGLRDAGGLAAGQKVLIHGASGGIGTFAIQIAKAMGAHVTALCSARNDGLVRSLGADQVIDYRQEDFSRSSARYDLIFNIAGNRSAADFATALNDGGRYVGCNGSLSQIMQITVMAPWVTRGSQKKMVTFLHHPRQEDLLTMKEMIEAEKVRPVIDRAYPMSETAAALRHYGSGHSRGKVVISVP